MKSRVKQFKAIGKNLKDFFADKVALRVTYTDSTGKVVTKMKTVP